MRAPKAGALVRVILIKGESAYDALRVFIDQLAAAFAERGYRPQIIDGPAEPDLDAAFHRAAKAEPSALVFTFNILGDYRDAEGRTLGQIFGAPHVIQYVDYPLTHWIALDRTAPDTALLTIDESHVAAMRQIYGPDHFAHVGFSPHAAIGEPAALAADPKVFAQRPIPLLFTGTFYTPGQVWWDDQPPVIRAMFQRAVEIALSVEWMPALDALDQALGECGLDPVSPDVAAFRKLATHIHEHVRARRRLQVLVAAAEAGLPLHVYGRGYQPYLERYRNVTFGGEAALTRTVDLMAQSQMVLNINANFGAGSHERPLTALLAGAAAATDDSSFYASAFRPGEVALYRWGRLEEDLAALGRLLQDPEALWTMAKAGQQRVLENHRWRHRIDAILAAAEAAKPRLAKAA